MDDNSSDSSIVEIQIEKKLPPVIQLDEEELLLNLKAPSETHINPISTIVRNPMNCNFDENQKACNPDHWTKDMIKYYNDDWGGEDVFVVKNLQDKMNKDPDLWKVSNKDILNFHSKKKQKQSKLRCWNCWQPGHAQYDCPDPYHEQRCHMCSGVGHDGKSCPNAKCLNCGASSRSYVSMCNKCVCELKKKCSRCNLEGHYFINCPDHWRKYHCTIETKEIRRPDYNVNKPLHLLWCCNCGKKGHHQTRCSSKRNSPAYPDALPYIASYDDLFTSQSENGENAKRRRYFENESSSAEKRLTWTEKIDNVIESRSNSPLRQETAPPDEITVLFERKDKQFTENPFKNWKEWFSRSKRKYKHKNKGKHPKMNGNDEESPRKKNKKKHRDSSELGNKKINRKAMFMRRTDKRAIRQNNYR